MRSPWSLLLLEKNKKKKHAPNRSADHTNIVDNRNLAGTPLACETATEAPMAVEVASAPRPRQTRVAPAWAADATAQGASRAHQWTGRARPECASRRPLPTRPETTATEARVREGRCEGRPVRPPRWWAAARRAGCRRPDPGFAGAAAAWRCPPSRCTIERGGRQAPKCAGR